MMNSKELQMMKKFAVVAALLAALIASSPLRAEILEQVQAAGPA
jgi:hypothetical protein